MEKEYKRQTESRNKYKKQLDILQEKHIGLKEENEVLREEFDKARQTLTALEQNAAAYDVFDQAKESSVSGLSAGMSRDQSQSQASH